MKGIDGLERPGNDSTISNKESQQTPNRKERK